MKVILTEQDITNMVKEVVKQLYPNLGCNNNMLINEELLNEGFKDFIKKFALTAAIATSCLTAAAKPAQTYVDNKKLNKEIIQKENDLVNFGYAQSKDNIHLIIKQGQITSVTQQVAREEFYRKTVYQGINARILKTEYFQNPDTGQKVVVIYYIIK